MTATTLSHRANFITIGTTYEVTTRLISRAQVNTTQVFVDGLFAGVIEIRPATANRYTEATASAARYNPADRDYRHDRQIVYTDDGVDLVDAKAHKGRAIDAIVRFWHDNNALKVTSAR